MPPLILATANPHKLEELRAIFAESGIPTLGLPDLPGHERFTEPAETGATFEANATIKALSYARLTGHPCLADDSGLEVDALGGAPGVISSHYSTGGRETGLSRAERDAANNARLLRELQAVPWLDRTARFACVMALANPGGAGFQPDPAPQGGRAFSPTPLPPTFDGRLTKGRGGDLPHWQQGGAAYFVTFRTLQGELTPEERRLVCTACFHWHESRVFIHIVTVMPDHAHILFTPIRQANGQWPTLPGILHSIKSFTAREIQRTRGRSGKFWQEEYFDRIVRDDDEFVETWNYIALNPARAGLVKPPESYPFTLRGRRSGLEARPPQVLTTRGTLEGRIGLPPTIPRGHNGFGYDPLFLLPDGRTGAELSTPEKNAVSHRGTAARLMAARIIDSGLIRGP